MCRPLGARCNVVYNGAGNFSDYKDQATLPSTMTKLSKYHLFLVLAILMLVAASRILRLGEFDFHQDEVWTVYQTFGSPAQIIHWTPFDWAPLYFLLVGLWRSVAGIHPLVLRFSSVLISLVSAALFYRVGRRLFNSSGAALIAMMAYAAVAYGEYQSVILRGYILLQVLAILAFWLTLRFFEAPNFSLRRAIPLALCLTTLFYTQLTGVVMFGFLGIYTVLNMPRKLLRWLLPIIGAAILCIPQVLRLPLLISTVQGASPKEQLSLPQMLIDLFNEYTGNLHLLWAVLLIIAVLVLLLREKLKPKLVSLILWLAFPAFLYVLHPLANRVTEWATGEYKPPYFWALLLPLGLLLGWGLSRLPRLPELMVTGLIVIGMFWTLPAHYPLVIQPFMDNFAFLSKHVQAGDVILIDPNTRDPGSFMWDYFTQVYLPNGIPFVTNPAGHRRVWYVSIDGGQNPATYQTISQNRLKEEFVGPFNFLFRLYEAPPDDEGVLFENGMRFHGADVIDPPGTLITTVRDGQDVRLRLWWTVDHPPTNDYSIGLYVTDKGNTMLFQDDGPPHTLDEPTATSQWLPGHLYVEERTVHMPDLGITVTYPINMAVYQSWDNKRIAAPGVNGDTLLTIQSVEVKSWRLP